MRFALAAVWIALAASRCACGEIFTFDADLEDWYINQGSEAWPDANPGDPVIFWTDAASYPEGSPGGALALTLDLGGSMGDPMPIFDATIIQSSDWYPGMQPIGDFSGSGGFACRVFVPEEGPPIGPEGLMATMFVKSGEGWKWYQGQWTPLAPGQWNELVVATEGLPDYVYDPTQVWALGVKIGGNIICNDTVYVDYVTDIPGSSTTPDGWLRPGWNLISFPRVPPDANAAAALDETIAAGNDITMRLLRYSPSEGYSSYPDDFTEVDVGVGYWLLLDYGASETLYGDPQGAYVIIPLEEGWNLVGYPYPVSQPWEECYITDWWWGRSPRDAAEHGWIQEEIYFLDDGYKSCPGDDGDLRPWRGYWILALRDGLGLLVPAP